MKKKIGFTLLEMLLVLVIIGALVTAFLRFSQERYLNLRIEKTAAQMQQILNAALSYYVDNSAWPTTLGDLRTNHYLPNAGNPLPFSTTPWFSGPYTLAISNDRVFYVVAAIPANMQNPNANSVALSIAGLLPLSYTATTAGTLTTAPAAGACTAATCFVAAGVNIPGDNLNNMGGIKFAGVFHHGDCVPTPQCPANTTPEIYPVVASATGLYDTANDVYPITSLSAYYVPDQAVNPVNCDTGGGTLQNDNCQARQNGNPNQLFWRVCLSVLTQRGASTFTDLATTRANGAIMAFTRCKPKTENSGSPFNY